MNDPIFFPARGEEVNLEFTPKALQRVDIDPRITPGDPREQPEASSGEGRGARRAPRGAEVPQVQQIAVKVDTLPGTQGDR